MIRTIEEAANSIVRGVGKGSIFCLNVDKKLVQQRQKLSWLADREEKGWKFVGEYVWDNIANNSDDEKQTKEARCTVQEKYLARRPPKYQPIRQQNHSNFNS